MKKIIVILLALLLTGSTVLFCVSFLGRQVIMPAMDENGAQMSDGMIREQKQLVSERITALSELYGFDPGPVNDLISEDVLKDLNRQASQWWHSVLATGKAGEEISWDTGDLERLMEENAVPAEQDGGENAGYLAAAGAEEVRKSVLRTVLPMRQEIVQLGLQKGGKRIDLPNVISFFLGVPWASLALCLLLAGLIALAESTRIRRSLQYIGSALGAAALVLICLGALYLYADLPSKIREASRSLAMLYQHTAAQTMICAGILTALLIAGCILCLILCRRKERTV